jgi:hypothetical protein
MYLASALIFLLIFFLGAILAFGAIEDLHGSKGADSKPLAGVSRLILSDPISISFTLLVLGCVWTFAWFYYLHKGWTSFLSLPPLVLLHAALQILTASSFFVAAIGILKKWPEWKGIYRTNIFLLLTSTLISTALFGAHGHGGTNFMIGIGIVSLVISAYLSLTLYILSRHFEKDALSS